jgi:hypothetical protein
MSSAYVLSDRLLAAADKAGQAPFHVFALETARHVCGDCSTLNECYSDKEVYESLEEETVNHEPELIAWLLDKIEAEDLYSERRADAAQYADVPDVDAHMKEVWDESRAFVRAMHSRLAEVFGAKALLDRR